jgi:hypothetical protein
MNKYRRERTSVSHKNSEQHLHLRTNNFITSDSFYSERMVFSVIQFKIYLHPYNLIGRNLWATPMASMLLYARKGRPDFLHAQGFSVYSTASCLILFMNLFLLLLLGSFGLLVAHDRPSSDIAASVLNLRGVGR